MSLLSLSPLDGRYSNKVDSLRPIISEFGLIKARLTVEIRWFQDLGQFVDIDEVPKLSDDANQFLNSLIENFDEAEAESIKKIEETINHDVKSVEYYLKKKMSAHDELKKISQFVHFACTSADINNLSYALMLKQARDEVILPELESLLKLLTSRAHSHADISMLSRTHGQSATPTTLGKEFANYAARLDHQLEKLRSQVILGKFNGATGNFNAHLAAYPNIDWVKVNQSFVESLGLTWNLYTAQIEPHDWIAEFSNTLSLINTQFIDFARDTWAYISLGYFGQTTQEEEVGSSTMPHKVNPIDFENAEGNFGVANALLRHFSEKLPISRWQRDLTDSTVMRNLGVALGHTLLALRALNRGINKLEVNMDKIQRDLNQNWEVLGEAIQTVMRRYGLPDLYEQLKELTRGKGIDEKALRTFISSLELPDAAKSRLMSMTVADYIGLASTLAQDI